MRYKVAIKIKLHLQDILSHCEIFTLWYHSFILIYSEAKTGLQRYLKTFMSDERSVSIYELPQNYKTVTCWEKNNKNIQYMVTEKNTLGFSSCSLWTSNASNALQYWNEPERNRSKKPMCWTKEIGADNVSSKPNFFYNSIQLLY